jgi:bifunctional non-homologous end joining protein LigD
MQPMLATAAHTLPRGDGWAFEFKWDGVRALLDVSEHGVHLFSRAGNEVTAAYPELVAAAGAGDALVDGEIVVFVDGRPSFEALQTRMHVRVKAEARRLATSLPVAFVAFDLLRLYGVDLTGRPYTERRATLERWAAESAPGITVSPAFDDGPATEAAARQHGLEGVVAKRVDSAYRPGVRSRDWQKFRFVRTGDFAVVGWEAPREAPDTLSSLVLAVSTPDGLVFAGKAGSGLTARTATALQRRMRPREDCPLPELPPPSPGRVARWVEPEVVVEIEFTLLTTEGRLRHPVFRRIREDKKVDEAVGDA